MSDYYLFSRANIVSDHITACRASELYAEALGSGLAVGLRGDPETGFCFWSVDADSGLKLIRYSVTPMPAGEVPDDVRDEHSCGARIELGRSAPGDQLGEPRPVNASRLGARATAGQATVPTPHRPHSCRHVDRRTRRTDL